MAAREFSVGQRVRVRLNGECECHHGDEHGAVGPVCQILDQDGVDEELVSLGEEPQTEGERQHIYLVEFEQPGRAVEPVRRFWWERRTPTTDGVFCAEELELCEEPTDAPA